MNLTFSTVLAQPYLEQLIHGMQLTAILTIASWAIAVALGTVLATIRISANPVADRLVAGYVAYHQNVPIIAHLFLWYFGISTLLPPALSDWVGAHNGETIFAVIAIGLYMAAYFSEDIRSGFRAVPAGQQEAARSLGMGFAKSMRYVILPQAFRAAMPPIINHTIVLFKCTSLAMALGAAELTYVTREIENETFKTFETYLVATIFYQGISLVLMALGAVVSRGIRIPAR